MTWQWKGGGWYRYLTRRTNHYLRLKDGKPHPVCNSYWLPDWDPDLWSSEHRDQEYCYRCEAVLRRNKWRIHHPGLDTVVGNRRQYLTKVGYPNYGTVVFGGMDGGQNGFIAAYLYIRGTDRAYGYWAGRHKNEPALGVAVFRKLALSRRFSNDGTEGRIDVVDIS